MPRHPKGTTAGFKVKPRPRPKDLYGENEDLPVNHDWSHGKWTKDGDQWKPDPNGKQIIMSPIREQKDGEGTCAYHATSVCIEAAYNIKYNSDLPIQLSVQELLDCVKFKVENYKSSTRLKVILDWVVDNYLSLESDYKHTTGNLGSDCLGKGKGADWKAVTIMKKDFTDEEKEEVREKEVLRLVHEQPIIVVFDATNTFVEWSGKEIYRGVTIDDEEGASAITPKEDHEDLQKHAMLLVGYGTTEDGKTNYWIVRNSWGLSFGEGGYGKVARASSLPGGETLITKIFTVEAAKVKEKVPSMAQEQEDD
ncbi:unnamed protein product [Linum trigynum]|uniref:Peptidase C1A papain C-terminal domain-containing protein n=1 Tax=Linum trigynum TaxID=586398 RepID=A0AAV2C837_9ROSI